MSSTEITEIITQTINSIFNNLLGSINNSLYSILDDITFVTPNIINDNYFQNILGSNSNKGILLIANSLLIGFVLYYCIQLLFASYINSKIESPYKFIFKILLITIFLNNSFFICEKLLFFNSTISSAIREIGENLYNKNICFSELINELNSCISISGEINLLSFNGILKFISTTGLLNLIFNYSLRYIMIKVFILIFPFCILSLLNPNSSWIFKSWIKCFLSLLLIQQLISIIFLIIFSINFNSDTFSQFMYIGSIYALIKANSYIREIFGGISTDVHSNISNFSQLLKK